MRHGRNMLIALTTLLVAGGAYADDDDDDGGGNDNGRVLVQARYESDPSVPTFPPPASCAAAPFQANGYVEGALTAFRVGPRGKVRELRRRTIGYARACIQLTDFSFTPFASPVPIHWQIDLDGIGSLEATGFCMPTNNTTPTPGVVLGGCVMTATRLPAGYSGGNVVEGAVVFNPFGVPGFEKSSSVFTVHLFRE